MSYVVLDEIVKKVKGKEVKIIKMDPEIDSQTLYYLLHGDYDEVGGVLRDFARFYFSHKPGFPEHPSVIKKVFTHPMYLLIRPSSNGSNSEVISAIFSIDPKISKHGYIVNFRILTKEEERGKGYATIVFKEFDEYYSRYTLICEFGDKNSKPFFEKNGFKVVEKNGNYYVAIKQR